MRTLLVGAVGVATACALLSPTPAKAWGEDGHYIVAMIAENHLTPKARANIRNLIGNRSVSDPNIPVWADDIKYGPRAKQYEWTTTRPMCSRSPMMLCSGAMCRPESPISPRWK